LANKLRSQAVSCELYLSPADSLDKQLKYADKKQIPYVLIVGENEMKEGKVTLKELATREQITTGFSEVEKKLKQI
jgi:histidyl-tRNA synthetase